MDRERKRTKELDREGEMYRKLKSEREKLISERERLESEREKMERRYSQGGGDKPGMSDGEYSEAQLKQGCKHVDVGIIEEFHGKMTIAQLRCLATPEEWKAFQKQRRTVEKKINAARPVKQRPMAHQGQWLYKTLTENKINQQTSDLDQIKKEWKDTSKYKNFKPNESPPYLTFEHFIAFYIADNPKRREKVERCRMTEKLRRKIEEAIKVVSRIKR